MSREIKVFTRWRIEGNLAEISAILTETGAFSEWWPEAWSSSKEIDPGGEAGVKRTSALVCRTVPRGARAFSVRLDVDQRPLSWTNEINGAVNGRATWSLHQDGPMADIGHEWRVRLNSSFLCLLGPLGRAWYRVGFRRAMRAGEAALTAQVKKRRSHRA